MTWRADAPRMRAAGRDSELNRRAAGAINRPGPGPLRVRVVRVLIVGRPLKARYTTPAVTTTFVRGPAGVLGRPDLAARPDPTATLPGEALYSGYRRDHLAIWHTPGDQRALTVHA